ncbi:alpha/beta family hydrolase [Undibacterium sp. Ji50W]|uniref:alpha/beta family hydrolase n=1 Tax=Undibacterium sp. Ji50W TaxID=3413041 RepID=UPI003BF4ACAA
MNLSSEIKSTSILHLRISDAHVLEVCVDFPEGAGPFPALILAPGLRYDMHRPVIAQSADHLVAQGIAVYRFNWIFYTVDAENGHPSADLSAEIASMQVIIAAARSDARVNPHQLSVAGKSFGSVVAWQVFQADKRLQRCILMTPLCKSEVTNENEALDAVRKNYPDVEQESRPVAMMAGDQDPYCELPLLYRYAASFARPATVIVLPGNHSFEMPSEDIVSSEPAFQRTMDLLVRQLGTFLLA